MTTLWTNQRCGVAALPQIRFLETQNENKAQELVIAYQRISDLEQQVSDLSGTDASYASPESQLDFIKKVADSRTKFSKEAQDILASLNSDVQP